MFLHLWGRISREEVKRIKWRRENWDRSPEKSDEIKENSV
jgi:hypothetical protein